MRGRASGSREGGERECHVMRGRVSGRREIMECHEREC